MGFRVQRLTLRAANAFVSEHHRHSDPVRGSVFQFGCQVDGELVGVCIAGRPSARLLDSGERIEVLRTCVAEGTHCQNVNSWMYGHARKVAALLGFPFCDDLHLDFRVGGFVARMRLADWRDDQARAQRLAEAWQATRKQGDLFGAKAPLGD